MQIAQKTRSTFSATTLAVLMRYNLYKLFNNSPYHQLTAMWAWEREMLSRKGNVNFPRYDKN